MTDLTEAVRRETMLALAEKYGAKITGKPDGSEPIGLFFTIEQWKAFSLAEPIGWYDEIDKTVPIRWQAERPHGPHVWKPLYDRPVAEPAAPQAEPNLTAIADPCMKAAFLAYETAGGGHWQRMEAVVRALAAPVAEPAASGTKDDRSCTCHPDERPAKCQKKYALSECLAASAPPQPVAQEPDAYVPIHPRTGPLWMDVYPAATDVSQSRPKSYPVRALYFDAGRAARAQPANLPTQEEIDNGPHGDLGNVPSDYAPQPVAKGDYPPLPLAFEYVYEFKAPGGVHRKLTIAPWNGSKYSKAYTVYTAEQVRAAIDADRATRSNLQVGGDVPKRDYCPEKLKPGGCQLHNLHCGFPACNAAPSSPGSEKS